MTTMDGSGKQPQEKDMPTNRPNQKQSIKGTQCGDGTKEWRGTMNQLGRDDKKGDRNEPRTASFFTNHLLDE